MTLLTLNNFGGEVPREPLRRLPPPNASLASDLLATAAEFRPLQQDRDVAVGVAGARTLYRLARNADGTLRSDDGAGWITSQQERSYVKGQLNDDATERTVVSVDDGTLPPRVIDATGEDRLLGVPAPPQLALQHEAAEEFTLDEATTWVNGVLVPAVETLMRSLLLEDQHTSRVRDGAPVAGAYAMYGTVQDSGTPWRALYRIPSATAATAGLSGPELGGFAEGGYHNIPFGVLPFWGTIQDRAALENGLRAVESPKDGSQLFTDLQISEVSTALLGRFDPAGDSIKARRQSIDASMQDVTNSLTYILQAVPTAPTPPTKPTVAEWVITQGENDGGSYIYGQTRAPEWVAYDAAYTSYEAALKSYNAAVLALDNQKAARLTRARSAQASAESTAAAIEAEYLSRKEKLASWLSDYFTSTRGVILSDESPNGLFEIDADRVVEARFYIATYVTDWGEESAPGPVSEMLEVDQNDTVEVTVATPPADRHITHWRLYRSNAGSEGAAFQFVDEMLISTRTYSDSLPAEKLGEVCPTVTWAEPPYRMDTGSSASIKPPKGADPYLRGLVGMPNGIAAGFIDNFVAFCEPYVSYAWPVEYQIALEYPVVGLGVFGQTLFVGTMGNPYLVSGSDSASMSALKLDSDQACVSRRSIVAIGGGVVYASPDGLCFASSNGVELMTAALFAREDWQALEPATLVAAAHEGVYYFGNSRGTWALDTVAKKLIRVDLQATAMFRDMLTDHLFYAGPGGVVRKAFSTGRRVARWESGLLTLPAPVPFAWLQVDGDQDANSPVTVRWYGDGQLRHTATVTDIAPQRLPPGRYLEHQIAIETKARLTKVQVAGETQELKNG